MNERDQDNMIAGKFSAISILKIHIQIRLLPEKL